VNAPPAPQKLAKRQRARLIKGASYASLAVALSLALAKAWAWQATDSVSLLSSLADSVLDLLASGLTFWAVRFSLAPADREHRFGHGKSEGLAALVQSVIIMGSGVYVSMEAIGRLLQPAPIDAPGLGVGVMLGATVTTVALVSFQHYVARRTGSAAIRADAMHYKTDVLVNLGVAASILLVGWTGWQPLDPLVGLAVAAYILFGAYEILSHALDILLDREIPDQDRQVIKDIALSHSEVQGLHDMKTRFGGAHYIVQMHLELNPQISLWRSHEILDEVEDEILKSYPECEIIIHPDPIGFPEKQERYE
jgi:ferrous-iron efflux pump FieF